MNKKNDRPFGVVNGGQPPGLDSDAKQALIVRKIWEFTDAKCDGRDEDAKQLMDEACALKKAFAPRLSKSDLEVL